MKNIHVIPTPKPSRLYKHIDNPLVITYNPIEDRKFGRWCINQNIYITSDSDLDINDWVTDGKDIWQVSYILADNIQKAKKIILTTDQDLDGVQAIDDEFLEWFVKNPSCEEVEVRKIEDELISSKNPKIRFNALQDPPSFISTKSLNDMILTYKYKIIIPKEEPKPLKKSL
jgi:hypothetical protein